MSFCTYCVWKHPGVARTGFSCPGSRAALGNPRGGNVRYCALCPSTRFALCLPGVTQERDSHG